MRNEIRISNSYFMGSSLFVLVYFNCNAYSIREAVWSAFLKRIGEASCTPIQDFVRF